MPLLRAMLFVVFFIISCNCFSQNSNTQVGAGSTFAYTGSFAEARKFLRQATDTFVFAGIRGNTSDALHKLLAANDNAAKPEDKILNLSAIAYSYIPFSAADACYYYGQMLALIKDSVKYRKEICEANLAYSLYYCYDDKFDSAIAAIYKAEAVNTNTADTTLLVNFYDDYGLLYFRLGLYRKTLNYTKKALQFFPKKMKWCRFYTQEYLGHAYTYAKLFEQLKDKKYADTARSMIRYAMKMKKATAGDWYQACYYFLGYIDFDDGQYGRAIQLFDSCMLPAYNLTSQYYPNYHFLEYLYKGVSLLKLGYYNDAYGLLSKLSKTIKRPNYGPKQMIYQSLYEIAKAKGDLTSALKYHELYKIYSDSLDINGQKGRVFEDEQKYMEQKREAEFALLENKNLKEQAFRNKLLLGSVVIALILLIVSLLLYIQTKRQQYLKEAALLQQRKAISNDMHDEISSGIATLRFYIADIKNQLEDDKSKTLLGNIQEETDALYQQSREFMHKINSSQHDKEESVSELLENLKLRFSLTSVIELTVEADAGLIAKYLKPRQQGALCAVIKEAVANSLKHSEASSINIRLFKRVRKFYFVVEDNGKGFTKSGKGKGLGLLSMEDRIRTLGGKIAIETGSKGTAMRGWLPVK